MSVTYAPCIDAAIRSSVIHGLPKAPAGPEVTGSRCDRWEAARSADSQF
jgi:hypothetical protein